MRFRFGSGSAFGFELVVFVLRIEALWAVSCNFRIGFRHSWLLNWKIGGCSSKNIHRLIQSLAQQQSRDSFRRPHDPTQTMEWRQSQRQGQICLRQPETLRASSLRSLMTQPTLLGDTNRFKPKNFFHRSLPPTYAIHRRLLIDSKWQTIELWLAFSFHNV